MRAKYLSGYLFLFLCWPIHDLPADEFFRWFDDKGTLHFADNLHSVPERYRDASRVVPTHSPAEKNIPPAKSDSLTASSPRRYTLPLMWDGGRMLVDATLNDRIPVRCVIDTGSNMTVLPASLASRLGFDKKTALSIDVRGVSGVIEGRLIEVDSFKVGEAEVRNFEMIVIEESLGGTALLGADFLSRFEVEISYTRGQLALQPGEGAYDGSPALWWREKFRLYEALKDAYERRIRQNQEQIRLLSGSAAAGRNAGTSYRPGLAALRPLVDEIEEYGLYLGILANKVRVLRIRADGAGLPHSFRR